ncbi:type IV toxin-antitoxin system AbiEi family antitoxin domain-containing protein [Nocardioides piscis]|uniref:Type IV toxin-antitoxin system AbiEi family antitoxin domain-containing protein n=1 Tax=Nocardioides piscis TaxID=2714938 RepID=A0A6G7YFT1_9ACTN|nr:type IV toxin-antitoxin system AbiEi family antitoxin domain-containing protein [Nocardioides piscis]QIK75501.1 type IV toxin-antitoxin system AbiEi family antitoxin domain-containing protein [Nocardioides piscis]
MDSRAIGRMAAQHGLITRRQLLELGSTPAYISVLVRQGRLVLVRRAVYADPQVFNANMRWDLQQLLRDRAASMVTTAEHRLSHDSSALRLGMQVLKQDGRTHLTHTGRRGTHTRYGISHHFAPFRAVDAVPNSPLLSPARTALDIAREHGVRSGTVAVDSALRLGATYAELDAVLQTMRHWPNRSHARAAIDLSDPDTDSVAETLARELVEELGHGRPQTQFGLAADGREVWCDLRLGRHFFEVDGRIKLTHVAQGGLATDPDKALWEEKIRQDFITGFKTGVSRIVWDDLWGAQREIAKRRLDREYADTVRRFGTDITDLAQFRPRRPRRRPTPPAAA